MRNVAGMSLKKKNEGEKNQIMRGALAFGSYLSMIQNPGLSDLLCKYI